jgi:triacylglycerol lipase
VRAPSLISKARLWTATLSAIGGIAGGSLLWAAPAGAVGTLPYPVVYNVLAASRVLENPTAPPAGANNWSCKPSAAHREPVVFVHGLGSTMGEDWATMSPLLADEGYCVFALTYGTEPGDPYIGGLKPMEQSSAELAAFVDQVLAATGASKVDLVGHSEGTVMPQYYLKFRGGAAKVAKYVALTPLYHGTTFDGITALDTEFSAMYPAQAAAFHQLVAAFCGSCLEFEAGSAFFQNLYGDDVYAVPGVQYTAIMTRYDELVTPYTSGMLNAPNATNIVVQDQCPLDFSDHASMAFDPVVAADILNALDPAQPVSVPCTLVLPGFGALAYS